MKRRNPKNVFWMGVIVAIFVGLWGCGGKTTPSGASFVYGDLMFPEGFGGSFTVLQWQEGLSIVLVDDIEGAHESSGSGSTGDPVWRGKGAALAADGRQVSWRVETTDGKTATFFVNEQKHNLGQGTLFLIWTSGGETRVMQHELNLAERCATYDECQRFLKDDPLVMQFIQETLNSY